MGGREGGEGAASSGAGAVAQGESHHRRGRGREVAKCKTPSPSLPPGALAATELAPYSDLDLLVLCAKRPGAEVEKLAEAILYPLWDAKVDAGHAVRAFDQALSLPATDLAAATALLDARFMVGDQALADVPGCLPGPRRQTAAEDFVARLRAEQKARHSRFGDTIFCSSPTSRTGRADARSLRGPVGGDGPLRDVGTRALQEQGVMTGASPGLPAATAGCCGCGSRCTRRPGAPGPPAPRPAGGDRAMLYPDARDRGGVIRPAVHPAVEALMHQYHAHAKLIRNETERLLQRATARDDRRRKTRPVMT